jgi:peptidase E
LLVYLGGSPGAIVTIVLIATDQVTDLLYSWYSLFAQRLTGLPVMNHPVVPLPA